MCSTLISSKLFFSLVLSIVTSFRRNLETNDWKGLAGRIYSEIFSPCFLTPLEPTDCGFRLEVQHVNLTKYAAMINSEPLNDDMDMVSGDQSHFAAIIFNNAVVTGKC